MVRRVTSSLAVLVSVAAAGCAAPISSLRPASTVLEPRSFEIGAGGSMVSPRPYVDEPTRGAGQMWLSGRVTRSLTLTGVAAREPGAFAAGGAARIDVLRTDRLVLAPEVELGILWGAVNAGAALRLFEQTWIYAAPRFGTRGSTWSVEVPAGFSIGIPGGVMLRAEWRVSWAGELSYYQQRQMFGAGLAVQF